MIVKNEENVLARCLNSCKNLFDEIVIVDTGSTDKTKQIAKNFTEKVYDFKWQDDFSLARNFAFSKASCDYIMWLDADDVMPKTTLSSLLAIKNSLSADVYMLKYNIAFLNNKPTFSYYRERIVKNCASAVWQGVVHECIAPFGKVEYLNCAINHKKDKPSDSNRNYNIYKKIIKTRTLSPREQYYYGRELFDHHKFSKCITVLKKFVEQKQGWVENVLDALYIMSSCYEKMGKRQEQFNCLLQTFTYAPPRANVACKIGDIFLLNKNYSSAIYWYKLATTCQDVMPSGGFVEKMYYDYYPYLQLCYCYYCLNDNKTALFYNNKAKKIFNSEQVKHNEKYFASLNLK